MPAVIAWIILQRFVVFSLSLKMPSQNSYPSCGLEPVAGSWGGGPGSSARAGDVMAGADSRASWAPALPAADSRDQGGLPAWGTYTCLTGSAAPKRRGPHSTLLS